MPDQIQIVKEIILEWKRIIKNDELFKEKLSVLLIDVNQEDNILEEDKKLLPQLKWKRQHYSNQEILSCLVWKIKYLEEYSPDKAFTQTSTKKACEDILLLLDIPNTEDNWEDNLKIPSINTMEDFINYVDNQFPELEFKNTCDQITKAYIVKLQEEEILTKFWYYEFQKKIQKEKEEFKNQKISNWLPWFLLDYKEEILIKYDTIISDYKKKIEEYLENAGYYKNATEYILQSQ